MESNFWKNFLNYFTYENLSNSLLTLINDPEFWVGIALLLLLIILSIKGFGLFRFFDDYSKEVKNENKELESLENSALRLLKECKDNLNKADSLKKEKINELQIEINSNKKEANIFYQQKTEEAGQRLDSINDNMSFELNEKMKKLIKDEITKKVCKNFSDTRNAEKLHEVFLNKIKKISLKNHLK